MEKETRKNNEIKAWLYVHENIDGRASRFDFFFDLIIDHHFLLVFATAD